VIPLVAREIYPESDGQTGAGPGLVARVPAVYVRHEALCHCDVATCEYDQCDYFDEGVPE
jgi:hypothetical protein